MELAEKGAINTFIKFKPANDQEPFPDIVSEDWEKQAQAAVQTEFMPQDLFHYIQQREKRYGYY